MFQKWILKIGGKAQRLDDYFLLTMAAAVMKLLAASAMLMSRFGLTIGLGDSL
jgi:hypothetical protein